MKHIMISVKPQFVAKILNGEKTIEIRKNMPKCELPCKVYIYCTKSQKKLLTIFRKGDLIWSDDKDEQRFDETIFVKDDWFGVADERHKWLGKVVADFTLKKIDQFGYVYSPSMLISGYRKVENDTFTNERIDYEKCCLSSEELMNYASDNELLPKPIFALYIDDLKIYDEPKKLCEFKTQYGKVMQRPFQSWGYVENV